MEKQTWWELAKELAEGLPEKPQQIQYNQINTGYLTMTEPFGIKTVVSSPMPIDYKFYPGAVLGGIFGGSSDPSSGLGSPGTYTAPTLGGVAPLEPLSPPLIAPYKPTDVLR